MALLELRQVSVVFDGFRALDVDTFAVSERELRVVIGPNGAGKTTLCDVISGKTRATSGRCTFAGEDISRLEDYQIARRGVGRKFQTPMAFDSLTVEENLELAAPGPGRGLGRFLRGPDTQLRTLIESVAATVGLASARRTEARHLSHGQRQLLELGTLLIAQPKLLLIDEPAAGLTDAETDAMAHLLLRLAGHHTLIVIEHDMDFVRALDATVTVLHEGRVLAEGTMQAVQADARVVDVYLGR